MVSILKSMPTATTALEQLRQADAETMAVRNAALDTALGEAGEFLVAKLVKQINTGTAERKGDRFFLDAGAVVGERSLVDVDRLFGQPGPEQLKTLLKNRSEEVLGEELKELGYRLENVDVRITTEPNRRVHMKMIVSMPANGTME